MKRWLIVPALILLLGGCTDKTSQIPEVETMQITTPTEPALYEDTHKVEAQTGGAVKVQIKKAQIAAVQAEWGRLQKNGEGARKTWCAP